MKRAISRRTFVRAGVGAGALLSLQASSWSRILGANDTIRVACVGIRSRGAAHIEMFDRLAGVEVVALCDVDRNVLGGRAEELARARTNRSVMTFTDLRHILDRKDVDVITIATPNHWHALQTIWSVQAGKDVYVEKPVSHNVWEGRQIVRAARKYRRIVQTGTQSRSSPGLHEAFRWIHDGNLGRIELVRGLCYKPRQSIGTVDGDQPVPEGIDYDQWIGPSPMVPLHREHLHYDWHWDFHTGNGDLGNQGIHQMDMCRWVLGESTLSRRVMSVGGRLGYVDDGDTPNSQFVVHDYARAPVIFEVRGLPRAKELQTSELWNRSMDRYEGVGIGVVVHCEGGHLAVTSYEGATAYDRDGREVKAFREGGDHALNFIEAVRARNASLLTADILEGHLSSALCHTGNISYKLGEKASPEVIRERVGAAWPAREGETAWAVETLDRLVEHLERNEVDLKATELTVGPLLTMDDRNERFPDREDADRLRLGTYREPYVVPRDV